MKKNLFFILYLINFCAFGQNDSIEKRISSLDIEKTKLIMSENIKIDSIEIKVYVFENQIETESYFEKSKSKLSVIYWKKAEEYHKIVTRENCPSMPEDFWHTYVFDFKNGKIINEEERYYSSSKIHGIAGHVDKKVKESYNKTLNSDFLKKYVAELFEKIKNYR